MTTRRVNAVNVDLEEEWERDPRDDMVFEYDEVEDSDDATTLLASPETFDGDMGRLRDELVLNGEPIAFDTEEDVDQFERRFLNLQGSYSSPIPNRHLTHRPDYSPITPPQAPLRPTFRPDSPMTPPSSPVVRPRRINFTVRDAHEYFAVPTLGERREVLFYEVFHQSEIVQNRDPEFKRKYEENGGDEFYKPSAKKMREDREFWSELVDSLNSESESENDE